MQFSSANKYLQRVDTVMRSLIREVGPCTLKPRQARSPFESLARAIAYQQLHDKAAASILKRFIALFPGRRFPRPVEILVTNGRAMRRTRFSRAKVAALRDLAMKALNGTVPTSRVIKLLDDEAIIEQLIEVRGIGRWTVEMLLIFMLAVSMCCQWGTLACATASVLPMDAVRLRRRGPCYDMESAGNLIEPSPRGISGARWILATCAQGPLASCQYSYKQNEGR